MEPDLNLWGIFAMPVGLIFCFGPALIAWIMIEGKTPAPDERERKH
jgi:hypothetical protein